MPHISITQLGAERLRPQAADVMYWDKNLPGFGLRVSPKGRKSFICQYRVRGTKGSKWTERQVVLGTLNFLTVAEARDRARRYKAQASEGTDPVEQTKQAQKAEEVQRKADAFTFAKLVDRYQNEYLTNLKPGGVAQKTRLLKRWLPTLGDKPVSEIQESDILAFINGLLRGRANGRYEADHLVGALKHLFTWARKGQNDPVLKSLVATNPAADIARWAKPSERDRVLSHDEIRKFWVACDTIGWPGGRILQLLLLTGQRENEVAQCCWSEWDLANRVWNLPVERAKNSKAHIVHLSDMAMEIITDLPRINGSPLVFTMNGQNAFTNFDPLRHRVHKLMGSDIPHWQIRDLRRTATTLMIEAGVAFHVADKVLNHSSGQISGVAAVYNRFEYLEERKAALNALGRFIETLIGRDISNVVPLRA
jgi:integrase